MTDIIEQKMCALVGEVRAENPRASEWSIQNIALCRAIEQHEAFRQEVSDAVEQAVAFLGPQSEKQPRGRLAIAVARFIIAKPDPLVEAMQEWWDADGYASIETFRAAIEKRGGRIVWGDGND